MAISLLVTDANLKIQGDPIGEWTDVDVLLKFNETGTGTFSAPAHPALLQLVETPGNRVCVVRDGQILSSGPIERRAYTWNAGGNTGSGADPGEVTVTWADNLAYLTWRLTYPDPANEITAQATTYWAAPANQSPEVTMRALVNANAAGGAIAKRRIPKLALGTLAGVGTAIPVAVQTRLEVLTDTLRTVALAGGNIGFRVRDTGTALLFECYAPTDRSRGVRFSRRLQNLTTLQVNPEAPTGTAILIGGSGSGSGRAFLERASSDTSTWGRIEKFVSQATDSVTLALQQAGDQALAENAYKPGIQATALDTADQRYGVAYNIGDRVGVETASGQVLTDIVTAVHLTATPKGGELVSPTVGAATSGTTSAAGAIVAALRDLEDRVSQLQRS